MMIIMGVVGVIFAIVVIGKTPTVVLCTFHRCVLACAFKNDRFLMNG